MLDLRGVRLVAAHARGGDMIEDFEKVTLLNVLEWDGLISIDAGVAHMTERFQKSLKSSPAARRARRNKTNIDLREPVSQAMHALYGKYLSEEEMQRLVDAMMPIARSDSATSAARK